MNLQLENLCKSYGQNRVIDSIFASFSGVHSLVFIGPSGSGKSTLLRLIAGLAVADTGRIHLNGKTVPETERGLRLYRRELGVVFQAYNLFPHLTALENLTLPLTRVHERSPKDARETAFATLARLDLEQHAHKYPDQLSGGQKQRVAIARAIAVKPKLLLFDEPTSALDPEMASEVLDVIDELKQAGTDFILVTHQMGFARRVADQVAFLVAGTIVENGTPEQIFQTPQTKACGRFLEKVLNY
jgi:polar amino acid transport system ATP-binding protein